MSAKSCHRSLAAQLRSDPAFAFEFARRFRDIPPVEPGDIDPMLLMTFQPQRGADVKMDMVDIALLGHVRPNAEKLPNREPWPDHWILTIDVVEDVPAFGVMFDWPYRDATLRAQFRCPVTSFVIVPSFTMAEYVNAVFAVEPELTPVVVVSTGVYLDESHVN